MRISIASSLVALALPAHSWAGQIVYAHNPGPYSTSSNLYAMNDDGSNNHVLIPDNTYQGITEASAPDLRPGTTDLAFDASGPPVANSTNPCGVNCVGVYTLIGGTIRRVSPAEEPCGGNYGQCSSEIDQSPSLTADGKVVYEHSGSYTGTICYGYYCGPFGDLSSVFLEQSDLGGDNPTQWQTPNGSASMGQYQANTPLDVPFADPGNASLIAYAGLEDYNCSAGNVDACDPLTFDQSNGTGAYNVTDADCNFGSGGCYASNDLTILGWSPGGEYILVAYGSQSSTPGVWIFKNQPYSNSAGYGNNTTPLHGTGWWVWRPAVGSTVGQGGALTSETPGRGQIIFTYNGDIISIPGLCWGGQPTVTTGQPLPMGGIAPTCTHGTELTSDGQDNDPTWTSSTAPIAVNTTPTGKATSTLDKITHSGANVSATIACSQGAGDCGDAVGLATYETLRGSKVIAVQASKTRHKAVIVGEKSATLAAGQTALVAVSLNGAGRKLLKHFHKLPLLVILLQGKSVMGTDKLTLT